MRREDASEDRSATISRIAEVAVEPSIRAALAALRDVLGVAVAYATRHTDTDQVFETIEGDSASFGVSESAAIPLEATYCQRILIGELPSIIGDVRGHAVAGEMPITASAGVGAFASVPLLLSDGTLYGTLCCASHEPQPQWTQADATLMQVIARIVADEIERDLLARELHRAEVETGAIDALLAALDATEHHAAERAHALVAVAVASARALGLPENVVLEVEQLALLRELGRLGATSAPARGAARDETSVEGAIVGERIVAAIPSLSHLAPAFRAGAEHWDGTGGPDGLAGTAIPLASRVVLACETYRRLRRTMSEEAARADLRSRAGVEFDPSVIAALVSLQG